MKEFMRACAEGDLDYIKKCRGYYNWGFVRAIAYQQFEVALYLAPRLELDPDNDDGMFCLGSNAPINTIKEILKYKNFDSVIFELLCGAAYENKSETIDFLCESATSPQIKEVLSRSIFEISTSNQQYLRTLMEKKKLESAVSSDKKSMVIKL